MLLGRSKKNPIKIVDKGVVDWKYTTCGYCSTGCSLEVGLNKDGKAVASRGAAKADVNRGKLCLKGIFEHELFYSNVSMNRLLKPPGTARSTRPPPKYNAFRRPTDAIASRSFPPAKS